MSSVFLIGLIFFLGYIGGLLAHRMGLPRVSGYVVVGIVIGPSVTGVITEEFLDRSTVVVDFGLAMVAYGLGGHLRLSSLRRHGSQIAAMTLGQGLGAYLCVGLGSYIFMQANYSHFGAREVAALALFFGALSISTAPAATVATMHEYRARGRFTSTLMAIVALDDALALMLFAVTTAFVGNMVLGGSSDLSHMIHPFISLAYSTALGVGVGLVFGWAIKHVHNRDSLVMLSIGAFCAVYGIAEQLALESLFASMVLGATVFNVYHEELPFEVLERNYETVVLAVFFVIAGAHVDVGILGQYLTLALLFVLLRIFGKGAGAYMGGLITEYPEREARYMGMGLAPQAGVAVGLAIYLKKVPGAEALAPVAINVVLANTAVNEVFGPWLLKHALRRTGQTHLK
jgi:Kef-type K+ transport system membrane component KefB